MYIKIFSCLLLTIHLVADVNSEQWNGRINRYNQSYVDESWSNPYYGSYYDSRIGQEPGNRCSFTCNL